ncbi:LAFE_0G08526g1_1 [Lachancea fermentati]|uniref:LAFE_0G08526g1_1 n=1 Tax=Lachancea fermentati TaxID=4955 RepID=A0A1G4MHN3_LACFM|nr:LAFE_0G08526g1_1 [Lachancea fermentati]
MLLRKPTRTKTKSFLGSQMDFQFPSQESVAGCDLDTYHLSNHHLLNDTMTKKNDEDASSQILSDYTNSNSGNSSNAIDSGYYSFANISDNTTSKRTDHSNGISMASSWTSGSQANKKYPATLAPPMVTSGSPIIETHSSRKSIDKSHSAFQSISTGIGTIPTADNISFQISFHSQSGSTTQSGIKKSPTCQRNLSINSKPVWRSSSRSASIASASRTVPPRRKSNLKRSKAVKCKGGLLEFFSRLGLRVRSKIQRWRLAARKRLFAYRKRHNTRKDKKQITSHLKRANGYVSNIQRSMSTASLHDLICHDGDVLSQHLSSSRITSTSPGSVKQSPVASNPAKTNRNSLRRSPSSIKRAASNLTRANSMVARSTSMLSNKSSEVQNSPSSNLVRSQPSMSLHAIVRQPSIVVNNKVIPLSNLNGDGHEFSIKEEDEDEYVIDTDCMRPTDDNESEKSSLNGSLNEDQFEDADDFYGSEEILRQEKVNNAIQAWNHYLRSIIAKRIAMRLQVAKYQEEFNDDDCQELMDAIISDYEANTSSIYDSDVKNASTSATSVSYEDYDDVSFNLPTLSSPRNNAQLFATSNSSVLSVPNIQDAIQGSVKRSLTLPVGIKV